MRDSPSFCAIDAFRDAARRAFLARCDRWAHSRIDLLPVDASFRRYFRLTKGSETALLMDAPPNKENPGDFVRIARHLAGLGLRAPSVHCFDAREGFAIIEDFGDDTFTKLLDAGADPKPLYEVAIDVLTALHRHPQATAIDLPPYDHGPLLDEAVLLPDWYYPEQRGCPCPASLRDEYLKAWRKATGFLLTACDTLVLRDYHVDNLMRVGYGEGIRSCGLLDFQDACIGHRAYDVMSLLEDARYDVPQALQEAMLDRYLAAFPELDRNGFVDAYTVLAAQRHCKVAGIFVRLFRRDGKAQYLRHIPRVIDMLRRNLDHPRLSHIKGWVRLNLG
ncbi:MAG: phosphotransferase [Pseudomonadota bacterium]|nr:phosphotransferase [Pseudomonadota bacterium]